ncbi:MAG: hypothetical protein WA849_10235 [Candidatus Udaeobacter sp.]
MKLLQFRNDLFQLKPDPLGRHAALYKKCPRPFAATDLGYDVLNPPPRRDPFAPRNEGDTAERSTN